MRTARMLMIGLVAASISLGAAAGATEPPADRAAVVAFAETRTLPAVMTLAQRTQLNEIAARLRGGDQRAAMDRWTAFCSGYFTAANKTQAAQLQQWLVREGVIETVPVVALAADKVRFLNEQRREVAKELEALRAAKSANPTPHPVAHAVLTATFSKGAPAISSFEQRTLTLPQIDLSITRLEGEIQSLSNLSQQAQLDLQSTLDRQQQLLSLVSNIAKQVHDAAKSIIDNLR